MERVTKVMGHCGSPQDFHLGKLDAEEDRPKP